jgi:hypothetical protein
MGTPDLVDLQLALARERFDVERHALQLDGVEAAANGVGDGRGGRERGLRRQVEIARIHVVQLDRGETVLELDRAADAEARFAG